MSKPKALAIGRGNNQSATPKLIRLMTRLFIALLWLTHAEYGAAAWRALNLSLGGHRTLSYTDLAPTGETANASLRQSRDGSFANTQFRGLMPIQLHSGPGVGALD